MERVAPLLRAEGLHPLHLPVAVDMHPGGACIRCGTCDGFACRLGAKNGAEMRLINPALATGNVDLVANTKATRLLTDPSGRRIDAFEVEAGGRVRQVRGGLFVAAVGVINSAALLLRAVNDRHPRGLGNNESDQLGRNYLAQNTTVMMAIHPLRRNPVTFLKTLCINDFYFENGVRPYPLGSVQSLGKLQAGMSMPRVAWASDRAMGYFAKLSLDWWIMSDDLPDPPNRVTLVLDGTIRLAYSANNLRAHGELVAHWGKVMRRIDCPIVVAQKSGLATAKHQCGTARFGRDPVGSVLDPYSRVWDIDNLFVVNASFLPSSTGCSPSLTIVARAVRAAERIAATVLTIRRPSRLPVSRVAPE